MRIYETMDTLEGLRQKHNKLTAVSLLGVVGFMLSVFSMSMLPVSGTPIGFVLAFASFGAIIVAAISASSVKREFDMIYKDVFAKAALEEILGDIDYHWQRGFSKDQVAGFRLVRLGNRFSSEDYLKANYKGVDFEMADVTIKHVVKTKNGSSTTIYFKGRMIKFDVSVKKVLALQVFTDNFRYRANPGIEMNKIQMEDVQFNKQFDVLSARDHDAFYALTPQLMERLEAMKSKYKSVGMHFRGDNLYMAINTDRNTFDADMKNKINFPQEMELMRSDVQDILDIIDILGLGNE